MTMKNPPNFNSYQDSMRRIDLAFEGVVKNDFLIAKIALISEVSQIAKLESRYRQYLLSKWNVRAKEATNKALDFINVGKTSDKVSGIVNHTMNKWSKDVLQVTREMTSRIYYLARTAAWKKATRQTKGSLTYNGPKDSKQIFEDVRKDKKADKPSLSPSFDTKDVNAIKLLSEQNLFWIGEHYDEHLSEVISAIVSKHMIEAGESTVKAGELIQKALKDELFKVNLPANITMDAKDYFEGLAANVATTARAYGQLRSFAQIGVTYYTISNPMDDRTCPVCAQLDGRTFAVSDGIDQIQRESAAESPEQLKSIHPWLSPKAVKAIADKKGSSSKNFAAAGLSLPPYHWKCRCAVDISTESSSFADLNPSDITLE